jgi:hypothetical protein
LLVPVIRVTIFDDSGIPSSDASCKNAVTRHSIRHVNVLGVISEVLTPMSVVQEVTPGRILNYKSFRATIGRAEMQGQGWWWCTNLHTTKPLSQSNKSCTGW